MLRFTTFVSRRPLACGPILAIAAALGVTACGGGQNGGATSSLDSVAAAASSDRATAQATVAADATTWTTLATENQSFVVTGTQTVRYGSGSTWISYSLSGAATCSNAYFGTDPAPHVAKHCEGSASTATWTQAAAERQTFTLATLQQAVRFGSGSAWISRILSGSVGCTNTTFGHDPAPGVNKNCEVIAAAAPPVATTPPQVCTPPLALVDTSTTAASVGNGTAASCTQAALRSALASHAVVTFNCGAEAVTIPVTATIAVPTDHDTVIDGGGLVTLDGGNATRILSLVRANYRSNSHGLTLQRIRLAHGRAPGTGYVAPSTSNPKCAYGYAGGAGAAIQVQDAVLHAIDVQFDTNAAATPGPDVGGGAIYALGSLDVTVVGSSFTGNSGSNAGAIGLLQSNGRIVNSLFQGNAANGTGQNYADASVASCPGVGHKGQGGAGGNGGAVGVDGADDTDVTVCGSSFVGNKANELAGGFFRTMDGTPRHTVFDRTLFQTNSAKQAGAAFVSNAGPLDITASTFSGNTATTVGGVQISNSTIDVVNSTFAGNQATKGLGGALGLSGIASASVLRNVTFANNTADGGSGYFSAAVSGDMKFPVQNTLFANNLTKDGGSPMQCGFNVASGTANFQWPRNHAVGSAPDTLCVYAIGFADPLLGAMAANGGPTPTLLPAAASPLHGAGRNCPATDQRGQPRSAASCTVGAVE